MPSGNDVCAIVAFLPAFLSFVFASYRLQQAHKHSESLIWPYFLLFLVCGAGSVLGIGIYAACTSLLR